MLTPDPDIRRLMALRAIEGGLLRLKWLAAATRFELALVRHARALKYNFNPNEPRVPAGDPAGGQWTNDGSSAGRVRLAGDIPTGGSPPKIPKERPRQSRDRTAVLKLVARRILQTGETVAAFAKLGAWFLTYSPTIASYNDPPRSLDELQKGVSTPLPGYDIHHIVEQNKEGGFTREDIDSPDNLVRIPRMKHWDINAWYQTENPDFGGQTPRAYLNGRNWDVQRAVGLYALRKFGVLKP